MPVDREAPLRFLRVAFEPGDWIAVLVKSADTEDVAQRVGPLTLVQEERFQRWLRFKNARGFNVFVGVNAITTGKRSRTRESIGTVRHVFLDVDREPERVLATIDSRIDLPAPSTVIRTSPGRAHVLWRVADTTVERVEALQKRLALELGTDMAATSSAQLTRLPGLFNHKHRPPALVHADYRHGAVYDGVAFPLSPTSAQRDAGARRKHESAASGLTRARRYTRLVPPAIAGRSGDRHTFALCCRLLRQFDLTDAEALTILRDWNETCVPPWTDRDLAAKVRSARRNRWLDARRKDFARNPHS